MVFLDLLFIFEYVCSGWEQTVIIQQSRVISALFTLGLPKVPVSSSTGYWMDHNAKQKKSFSSPPVSRPAIKLRSQRFYIGNQIQSDPRIKVNRLGNNNKSLMTINFRVNWVFSHSIWVKSPLQTQRGSVCSQTLSQLLKKKWKHKFCVLSYKSATGVFILFLFFCKQDPWSAWADRAGCTEHMCQES